MTIESDRTLFQKILYWNFYLAFWALLLVLAYIGYDQLANPDSTSFTIQRGRTWGRETSAFPIMLVHLSIWYFFYRKQDGSAKIFSVLSGFMILIGFVISPTLLADISEKDIDTRLVWFGLYVSLSQLLFGFFYKLGGYSKTIITSSFIKRNYRD